MFEISVETHFSAAHRLKGYVGDCSRLHGHNWRVVATVVGTEIKSPGMIIDFKKLKEIMDRVIRNFDHKNLSDLPDFKNINPTAENISKEIFKKVKAVVPSNVSLKSIQVWETDKYSVKYFET